MMYIGVSVRQGLGVERACCNSNKGYLQPCYEDALQDQSYDLTPCLMFRHYEHAPSTPCVAAFGPEILGSDPNLSE
jgi:hypothetical protein